MKQIFSSINAVSEKNFAKEGDINTFLIFLKTFSFFMALSTFEEKSTQPTAEMLAEALGDRYADWQNIISFVLKQHKDSQEVWNFGKSFGWSLRIKDTKRVLVYMTPGDRKFLVSLVFGKKATEEALGSDISSQLISIIDSAKVYAEGRGFRIEVAGPEYITDILKLIAIKLGNIVVR